MPPTEDVAYADVQGDRAATGPLTWGQRAMWPTVADLDPVARPVLSLRRTVSLSRRAAVSPTRAVRALAALVSRHESLRTRVRPAHGELWQASATQGRLPVLVHTVPEPPLDPEGQAAARSLVARLGDPPFDHASDWPLRAALVVLDGQVRQVVVVFSHSTVDFHAAETVLRDLRMLLLRGAVPRPPGLQSLDVAQRERQVERRRSDRAVEYWLRQFEALPVGAFDRAGPVLPSRYRRGSLTSTAIHRGIRLLAARHRVSSSTVLLAATAAALTAQGGPEVCGIVTMANNRFHPAYDTAISTLNQIALCRVDLAGRPDVAHLLARTARASLDAYRHAYYDPTALTRAFAEHGHDHGTALAPFCYLNDIRLPHEVPAGARERDEATRGAALSAGTFTWLGGLDRFAWRCRIQVVDAPGAVELVATVDTVYLPPERVERLLRGVEEIVVHAMLRQLAE